MKEKKYNRKAVMQYAKKWAYARNPKYYNFDLVGGDCTSFASQCIYEGSRIMNYKKYNGWYYINGNNKAASWSGVEFLYNFLINNNSVGPYGEEVDSSKIEKGDIVQLSFDGIKFSHTLVVVNIKNQSEILIASHTDDSYSRNLSTYNFEKSRFIKINGVRQW